MKKLLAILAASLVINALAETETVNGYTWTYRDVADGVEIYGTVDDWDWNDEEEYFEHYHPAVSPRPTGAVTIPSVLGGKPVIRIGGYAFYGCRGLTSITIPDGVTSIGRWAFSSCSGLTRVNISNLGKWCAIRFDNIDANPLYYAHDLYVSGEKVTSLEIPEGVINIDSFAFYGCSGLTSVTIPNSVTNIGGKAFYGCSGLTSVTMPDSVTSIGNYAFSGCNGLASVTIGDSVTSIGNYAFSDCSGFTSITIPNSVISIGSHAFSGCSGLISVTIPNSETSGVTSIGEYAFSGCGGLTRVTIGNGVTSIGSYAFHNCSGLTSVTIPDSVTSIGYSAFYGCSVSLYDVTTILGVKLVDGWAVGSDGSLSGTLNLTGIRGIGPSAFSGCSGLTSVTIPESVMRIGDSAFYGCSGLTSVTIGDGVTSIGDDAFRGCSRLTNVTIGNGVTSIGYYAFEGCSGLTSVTIGEGVKSIGGAAFSGCSGLTRVNISNLGKWCAISFDPRPRSYGDSIDYYNTANPLYYAHDLYVSGEKVTSLEIPEGVIGIGAFAFCGCTNILSVTIPESVKSIGAAAFYGCDNLTDMTLPLLPTGGLTIPLNGVAYLFCESVWKSNGLSFDEVIEGSVPLVNVSILGTVSNIVDCAFYNCDKLKSVILPDSVTSIGNYAFYNCRGLTSVTIPDSVTSIGYSAFYGCSGLTSVTIPDSVTSIGAAAFYGCSGLTSVNISNIGKWFAISFYNGYYGNGNPLGYARDLYISGEKATSLEIPEGVMDIGAYALYGCTNISSVTIPTSVTNISHYAFYGCSGLTSVTIPESVTSIGDYAFEGCSGLASVTFDGNAPSVGSSAFNGVRWDCIAYVPKGSTGWNVFEGERWNGMVLKYRVPDGTPYSLVANPNGGVLSGSNFGASDGTTSPGIVTVKYGTSDYSSLGVARKSGYVFLGWYTAASGGTQVYDANGEAVAGEYWSADGRWSYDGNVFVYAQWIEFVPKECTVTFDANGGECSESSRKVLEEEIVGELPTPSWTGYGFAGWWTSAEGGERVTAATVVTGDVTYYAHWIAFNIDSNGVLTSVELNGATDITIPEGVTVIGERAFEECTELTSVVIPEGVTRICDFAFYGCSALKQVKIPDSVTYVGEEVFVGCDDALFDLDTVPDAALVDGWVVDYIDSRCEAKMFGLWELDYSGHRSDNPGHVDLSDARGIADEAFRTSAILKTLKIGKNVVGICGTALQECSELVSIEVNPGNENYSSENGMVLTKDGTTLLHGVNGDVVIPAKVTAIGEGAFYELTGLTSVTFKGNAPTVGDSAFKGVRCDCVVYVPQGSTGWNVFEGERWNGMMLKYFVPETTPKTYTLTLNPNGGTYKDKTTAHTIPNSSQQTKPTYGKSAYWRVGTATRTGYTFNGWFTEKTGGTQVYDAKGEAVNGAYWKDAGSSAIWAYDGNVTVYAHWTVKTYTLTLDPTGGTYKDKTTAHTIPNSSQTTKPTYGKTAYWRVGAATRTGYTFKGWYDAKSGGKQVYDANGEAVKGDYWSATGSTATWKYDGSVIKLYAQWTAKTQFTLSANPNRGALSGANFGDKDGKNQLGKVTVKYGSTSYSSLGKATRDGYTFGGWFTERIGGVKVFDANGKCVTGDYWNSSKQWCYRGDLTVYAQWVALPGTYALTCDPCGGLLDGENFRTKNGTGECQEITVKYGYTNYSSLGTAKREGYTFRGWFTERTGGVKVFDANGKCVTGDYWTSDKKWKGSVNLTIYAQWTVKTYTLIIDPTGGTYRGATAIHVIPNATQTAKPTYGSGNYWRVGAATRTGYTFKGWYDAATGGKQVYDAMGDAVNGDYWNGSGNSAKWKHDGNVMVYAQWKPITRNLRFYPNGGDTAKLSGAVFGEADGKNKTAVLTVTYGSSANSVVGKARRAGYYFQGWFTDRTGGTRIYDSNGKAIAGNYWKASGSEKTWQAKSSAELKLYAQWKKAPSSAPPAIVSSVLSASAPVCTESETVNCIAYLPDGESFPVEVRIDADGFAVVELEDAVFCGYVADGVGELFSGDRTLYLTLSP